MYKYEMRNKRFLPEMLRFASIWKMGCSGDDEEEELIQMVRDFIESEPTQPISSSEPISICDQSRHLTLQELLCNVTETETEVLEKVSSFIQQINGTGRKDQTANMNKWVLMRLKMNGYDASLCKTSWVSSFGCPPGNYEYIEVMMKNDNDEKPKRIIVDIDFNSQFELARPTSTYKDLTDSLPSIFVGNEENLKKLITLFCSAAKESMKQRGWIYIPPWRKPNYMQCKWFSENCNKVSTSSSSSSSSSKSKEEVSTNSNNFGKWVPPIVKPKGNSSGGSGLSCQFSKMSIDCC